MKKKESINKLDNILPFPSSKDKISADKEIAREKAFTKDIITENVITTDEEDKKKKDFLNNNDNKNLNKIKRFIIYAIFAFALVCVIFFVMSDTSFDATDEVNTQPININGATNFSFCSYREGYIIARDGKISCYNTNQELQWEINGSKTKPTTVSCQKYSLTYYTEDKLAVVTNGNNTNYIETEGNVMFGSVNENGYCVLFTEESGLKNKISVYDDNGKLIYARQNADHYIPHGILSPDNTSLLTIEMSFEKEKIITSLKSVDITKKDKVLSDVSLDTEDVAGCFFTDDNKYVVVTPDALICYSTKGNEQWKSVFSDNQLSEFDFNNDDIIGLCFAKEGSNTQTKVVFYNTDGKKISQYVAKENIYDLDICKTSAMLRCDNKIIIINTKGKYVSSHEVPFDMRESIYMANRKCVFVFLSSNEVRLIKTE